MKELLKSTCHKNFQTKVNFRPLRFWQDWKVISGTLLKLRETSLNVSKIRLPKH